MRNILPTGKFLIRVSPKDQKDSAKEKVKHFVKDRKKETLIKQFLFLATCQPPAKRWKGISGSPYGSKDT